MKQAKLEIHWKEAGPTKGSVETGRHFWTPHLQHYNNAYKKKLDVA